MCVNELLRDEKILLKQSYYMDIHDNVSWYELSVIDDLVSDNDILLEYAGFEFSSDDFLC